MASGIIVSNTTGFIVAIDILDPLKTPRADRYTRLHLSKMPCSCWHVYIMHDTIKKSYLVEIYSGCKLPNVQEAWTGGAIALKQEETKIDTEIARLRNGLQTLLAKPWKLSGTKAAVAVASVHEQLRRPPPNCVYVNGKSLTYCAMILPDRTTDVKTDLHVQVQTS